ncbi:beta-N-acetylglucosaminidase domain-containing protein [Microbacterium sp. NPDC056044]|uniref:beta-N-acetylglucosaminidase domain-containing protein n=1 Tax=Microbacterium sp. NPDC056044 TaxID=3345690 RepID=UPI0035D9113C
MKFSRQLPRTLRLSAVAVVVAATVTAGLVAPAEAHEPVLASTSATGPTIRPTPMQLTSSGQQVTLPATVTVVAPASADPAAVALTRSLLSDAGTATTVSATDPGTGATVYVGGPSENAASAAALSALSVSGPAGLAAEGYVLAVGTDTQSRIRVVLSGIDKTGTYYGAQSLRQVITPGSGGATIWKLTVRDAPAFKMRGGMQSFYSPPLDPPWTLAQEKSHIEFLARNKMDTYFYGPSADEMTGHSWSTPYTQTQLAAIEEAVDLAAARHVEYIYRISPQAPTNLSNGICFTDPNSFPTLQARFEQLWGIGVRRFTVAWDDVELEEKFNCQADKDHYNSGAYGNLDQAMATAHAEMVNKVQAWLDTKPGARPLLVVPTEYFGNSVRDYRTRLVQLMTPKATIYWTGPAVISPTITQTDFNSAKTAFGQRPIAVWDNYPVNDYADRFSADRLLLGPVEGRAASLANSSEGITFNAMHQGEFSQLALFTAADFAWNPTAYNAAASWEASLAALGRTRTAALRAFAENNYASSLSATESAGIVAKISAFRSAWQSNTGLATAATNLTAAFTALKNSVVTLREPGANQLLATEGKPWLDKASLYGQAGELAVAALVAEKAGDTATMNQKRALLTPLIAQISASTVRIGVGVLDPFLSFALARGTELGDLSGTGRSDLLAVMANGTLNAYPNVSTTSGQSNQDGATVFGAAANVGSGYSTARLPIVGEFCGDRRLDILQVESTGVLRYRGNTGVFASMYGTPVQVGQGWQGNLMLKATDLDADGRADLLGVLANGDLMAYRNTGCTNNVPAFAPTGVKVGQGWSSSQLPILGDLCGDGDTDILTIDGAGNLRAFNNNGSFTGSMFQSTALIGSGWDGTLQLNAVELNGDGRADLLAVLSDGGLYAYRNTGCSNGIPTSDARVKVGAGWTATNLPVVTDLNGDSQADLLSVDAGGLLLENVNTGVFTGNMFTPANRVGQGWQGALFIL